MENVACPLCPDGTSSARFHDEGGFTARKCDLCGLVFVSPRPTEIEMRRLYEGQDTHLDVGAQIRKRHRKIAEARAALDIIRAHARGPRLLEIGIGAGYLLNEARDLGLDAVGLDVDPRFIRFAREALGATVIEGPLAKARLDPSSFDVVFHRNVLSHLADPVRDVVSMASLLRPGGVLIFETGNVAELPSAAFAGTDALALPDHLFHFSEATLRRLIARADLEIVEIRRSAVIASLAPITTAKRLFDRFTPQHPRSRSATPIPISAPRLRRTRLFASLVAHAIEERVARALVLPERRCSLVVVARKGAAGSAERRAISRSQETIA